MSEEYPIGCKFDGWIVGQEELEKLVREEFNLEEPDEDEDDYDDHWHIEDYELENPVFSIEKENKELRVPFKKNGIYSIMCVLCSRGKLPEGRIVILPFSFC